MDVEKELLSRRLIETSRKGICFQIQLKESPWRLRQPDHSTGHRCLRICSSSSLLQSALSDLKDLLWLHNGYPRGVITYNMNEFVNRNRNKLKDPITTVPKRDVFIVFPYLGLQSKFITKQLKSCIYKFYGCINLKTEAYHLSRW